MKKIAKSIAISICLLAGYNAKAQLVLEYNISNNAYIALPLSGIINARINWGDGSPIEITSSPNVGHLYVSGAGVKTVSITGTVTGFGKDGGMAYMPPTKIINWDGVGLKSLAYACSQLKSPIVLPNTLPPTVTDLSFMFSGASVFNQDISGWNTGSVKNMSYMFMSASAFNQPIGKWDTKSVTNMYGMFLSAVSFNQSIGGWNMSQVSTTGAMFTSASAFNQPLNGWNTSSIVEMSFMFNRANSFNQSISNWDIQNVKFMDNMFSIAKNFNQNLGDWGKKLNSGVKLNNMLDSSGLSIINYDKTLKGFNQSSVLGLNLGAAGLKYCSSENDRLSLTTSTLSGGKGWTINDNGKLASPLPTILSQPISQSNCLGSIALLAVSASGSPLEYEWSNGERNTNYITTSISGIYTVTITGNCGIVVSNPAQLDINTPPTIIIQPQNQVVCGNSIAQFQVSATGSNLSYNWSNAASNTNIMNTSTPGIYSVTIAGLCGLAISSSFQLTTTTCGNTIANQEITFPNGTVTSFTGGEATLSWSSLALASTYCLKFSRSLALDVNVKTICGLNTPNYLFVLSTSGLRLQATSDTIYYQVSGIDNQGNMSRWSAVQSFILNGGRVTNFDLYNPNPEILIYPNPCFDKLTLKNIPNSTTLELFSVLGRKIYSQNILKDEEVDLTNLESGIYILKCNTLQTKLIKR